MSTIANLVVMLGMDSSKFNRGTQNATKSLRDMDSTFQNTTDGFVSGASAMSSTSMIAATAIIGVVTALTALASKSIQIASDLAEIQNVTEVVFGESTKSIENFADSAGKQFGLSELAAKQYTGTMGSMFKAMNFEMDRTVQMSVALAKRTGDLASFFNVSPEASFEKVRAGIAGEMEPLRQWGIIMSVANLEAFALAKGIKVPYQEMSEGNKTLLRTIYLLERTAFIQGDYVRTSQGWANQTKLTTLTLSELGKTIGQGIIPTILPFLRLSNQMLAGLNDIAQGFFAIQGPAKGFLMVGGLILAMIPGLIVGMYALSIAKAWYAKMTVGATTAAVGFSKALLKILGIVGIVIIAVGALFAVLDKLGMIKRKKLEISQPIDDTSEAMKAQKAAAEKAAGGVNTLAKGLDNVGKSAKKMLSLASFDEITKIGKSASGLGSSLFDGMFDTTELDQALQDLLNLQTELDGLKMPEFEAIDLLALFGLENIDWGATWDAIQEAVDGWATENKDKNIIASLYMLIKFLLKYGFGTLWGLIVDAVDKWALAHKDSLVASLWLMIRFLAQYGFSELWKLIVDKVTKWALSKKGSLVADLVLMIWFIAQYGFATLWTLVTQAVDKWVKDHPFNKISMLYLTFQAIFQFDWWKVWRDFWATMPKAWDQLKKSVSLEISLLWSLWSGKDGAWTNFKTYVQNTWKNFTIKVDVITEIIFGQSISSSIKKDLNKAIDFINDFIETLNDKFKLTMPSIFGGATYGFNIPKIPRLAAGAIVDSPTLAVVGEKGKEAVMPLENNTGWIDEMANKLGTIINRQQPVAVGAGGGNTSVFIGNDQLDAYVVRTKERQALRSNGRAI